MSTPTLKQCTVTPVSQTPLQDFEVAMSSFGTVVGDKFCFYNTDPTNLPGRCRFGISNSQQVQQHVSKEDQNTMVVCTNDISNNRVCQLARDQSAVQRVCTSMGGTL